MRNNQGATTLKRRVRQRSGMQDFDSLPSELRAWLSHAVLPWRAGSVRTAYAKAIAKTGDTQAALAELDRIQSGMVAKDARLIWGDSHPAAMGASVRD